ncbi:hypothetical protein Tco_0505675 [Tanacetum coccineum]
MVVSPRADKPVSTLDEIMAALKSGQCAIVDIMTRIPLFSKSVQASRFINKIIRRFKQTLSGLFKMQTFTSCLICFTEHVLSLDAYTTSFVQDVEPGNRPSPIEIIKNVHKRQKEQGEWRDS